MIIELILFMVTSLFSRNRCTFHCLSSSSMDIDLKRTVSERLYEIILLVVFLRHCLAVQPGGL